MIKTHSELIAEAIDAKENPAEYLWMFHMKNDPDHPYPIGMARNDSIYELSLLYSDYKHRAEAAEVRADLNESAMNNLARKLTATEEERNGLRIKLEQAQHDLEVCRIEIEHLTRKAMTTPKYLDDALNKGDGVYRP